MSSDLPPIIQKAELARAMIERAVAGWSRAHRYTHGSELRQMAKAVVKAAHKLWRAATSRQQQLVQLSDALDELRMDMRLGQAVHAFRSFGEFDAIMQVINDVGRQCGAMQRAQRQQMHPQGQNAVRNARVAASQDTEYPGRLSGAKT